MVRGGYIAVIVTVIATACSSSSRPGAHPTPPPAARTATLPTPTATSVRAATPPKASPGALRGHGELALIAGRRLYLLGGSRPGLRAVALPGSATAVAWSMDHRWLSVRVARTAPPEHPYAYEPAAMFVVGADGRDVRRLTPLSRDVTDAAWSSTTDTLAVASFARRGGHENRVDLLTSPTFSSRTVLHAAYISSLAWSPDGTALAIGAPIYTRAKPERLRWSGDIFAIDPSTGTRRTVVSVHGAVLDLAGWTADGTSILYWPDPMGSGSIRADGLDLYAVPARRGTPRRLPAGGLVHQSWLSYSPDRTRVAIVGGGLRDIWGGHKHVVVCRSGDQCSSIGQPRHSVSLWPAWSPDGTLAFARLPGGEFPTGFGYRAVVRWTARSRLFQIAPGGRPEPILGVPIGATAPAYGADGTLLFIRGSSVWLKPPHAQARRVITGVAGLATATFYGFVPYRQRVAWTKERPNSFGGVS